MKDILPMASFIALVALGLWLYYDIIIKHKFEFKIDFNQMFK